MSPGGLYPRVLVVAGNAILPRGSGGMTLYNLYRHWPPDRLAQIRFEPEEPDPALCGTSWYLGNDDVPLRRLLGRLVDRCGVNLPPEGPAGVPSSDAVPACGAGWSPGSPQRRIAQAWLDCLPFELSPRFWSWVRDFKPDVIYGFPGPLRPTRLELVLAKKLRVPVVPHFMDNWLEVLYRHHALQYVPRMLLRSAIRRLMDMAPMGLGISPEMAREYSIRFGKRFESMMNCVDIQPFHPPAPTRSGPVRFVYVGGLHLERWRSLVELGGVMSALTARGMECQLIVHAPASHLQSHGAALAAAGGIVLGRSLDTQEVPAALDAADVLVHVESFAPEQVRYCRLSLSTKIPQYLAAGRPVLAYGPGSLASVRYIADNACGVAITRQIGAEDGDAFEEPSRGLSRLIDSVPLRQEMAAKAWQVASANHDAVQQRERLRVLLVEACKGYASGQTVAHRRGDRGPD